MTTFTIDDQWRSFQTYLAVYLAGMLHPRDVFTISRRTAVAPPLVEFRYDAEGGLRFSFGANAWRDDPDAFVGIAEGDLNRIAAQTVDLLRGLEGVDGPAALRLSASGPASSVSVLPAASFGNFGQRAAGIDPDRIAAQLARMRADIDLDGDVIAAEARQAGSRAFAATKNGSIAAIAFDLPELAIDGNVERVMSRLAAIATPLPGAKPEIRARAAALMPSNQTNSGLAME